jgi:predicted regulator of Ras-like GTPase activity (Roadblock/LC7/MglB family)
VTEANKRSKSGSAQLAELLQEMNDKGDFPISLLTDKHGFPIASAAAPEQDPERQSAVVALAQKTAAQIQNQLGMAEMDEISVYDANGRQLVCRPFDANGYPMILAVLVPHKRQSYRRLTNQMIKSVQQIWRL